MSLRNPIFTTCILMIAIGSAHAQDSAVFNASKNAWKLHYQDPETSEWKQKTYVQQNGIAPTIQSTVQNIQNQFSYRYRITNQRDAKQLVDTFRIWGIPLVYKIPNLPPVTTSMKDTDKWTAQYWLQLEATQIFQRKTVFAPQGWSASLRTDESANQSSFVWTPGLKDTDPDGIAPGRSQDGFTIMRTELPGMARAKLTGSTEEPWGLDNLPDTPFWREQVKLIQEQDYVLVPVMAPVITVPTPYNAAVLARSLRGHVQTWLKYGHIDAHTLARLNRQFDVLIPALDRGHRKSAAAAIEALVKECTHHHSDLLNHPIETDDERHAAAPVHKTIISTSSTLRPLFDRVCARVLIFNLRYIRTRLEG
ncbi:MAG: hypothetical protein ACOYB1_05960 [Limnohabitans sp.]